VIHRQALMHCPKLLEGISDGDWRHFEGEERAEELAESDRILIPLGIYC
jgi:hypothetical protein